jgi:hypothetical protein
MRPRLSHLLFLCVFCAAGGLAWLAAQTASTDRIPTPLVPGESYAVDTANGRVTFDVDFRKGSRYVLLLGSLGYAGRSYSIRLDAQRVPKVTVRPARLVKPLPFRSTARVQKRCNELQARQIVQQTAATDDQLSQADGPANRIAPNKAARNFYLHVTDGDLDDSKQYTQVEGRLVAEGNEVRIYLDRQQSRKDLSPLLLEEMVSLFDREIVPSFRENLGECRDVDGDGKFAVLMTPWLGRLQGGKTSLGGFVRGSDFRRDVGMPYSNCCDMLYLNSDVRPDDHLRTLLVHEYTHAVCFSARLPSRAHPHGLPEEDDWLNEAIAHVFENLYGRGWSNLGYRVSRFMNEPQAYPLVVRDYYQAGMWRNHGCRGATYLFLRWCVDQFGVQILQDLVQNPASGIRNLEWSAGVKFDELFRRWTIALYQSGRWLDLEPIAASETANPRQGIPLENIPLCRNDSLIPDSTAPTAITTAIHRTSPEHGRDASSNRPPATVVREQRVSCSDSSGGTAESSRPADGKLPGRRNPTAGCFTSLDLRGRLAEWGLAGPRPNSWNVEQGDYTVRVRGTAPAFVEMHDSTAAGVRRIQIVAERGTKLQVSLVKLPDDWPQLSIDSSWTESCDLSNRETEAKGVRRAALKVHVRMHCADHWRVDQIACEQNDGEKRETLVFAGEEIIGRRTIDGTIAKSGEVRTFVLPIDHRFGREKALLLKVVACDRHGRRTCAWSTVGKTDFPRRQLEIADGGEVQLR